LARHHLSIREFCERSGLTRDTAARLLRSDQFRGRQSTYRLVAQTFGLKPAELDQLWRPTRPRQNRKGIPIEGKAPAGYGDFVAANYGSGVSQDDDGDYLPQSLYPSDETAFAAWVEGDSMEPTLGVGDLLICSPLEADQNRVSNGDVVHVRFSGDHPERPDENTVKRIYDQGDRVQLVPDNRDFAPFEAEKAHIIRLAKVVRRITAKL